MDDCTYELSTVWRGRKRAVVSKRLRAHYSKNVGPIPDGHQLHHVCKDPACSNVEHLEPLLRQHHTIAHRYQGLSKGFNETAEIG